MSGDLSESQISHYQALGHLCAVWASLDRAINMLLQTLLDCPEDQVACLATQMDPVAARCALARQLIYTKTNEQWWIADYEALINGITNQIGPLRNRCIHDSWEFDEQTIKRIDRRAKLSKQGARTSTGLTFDSRHTMPTSEIEWLIDAVCFTTMGLLTAISDLQNFPKLTGLSPEQSILSFAVQKLLTPRLQALRDGKPYHYPYSE